MNTERDVTRIVRSWLQTEEYESADRVLANVLAKLDTTPRRRSWWPARRFAEMNTYAKLAIAAAAVVVVAVVGINLLPARGGVGGIAPTPVVTPKPTPAPTPTPSPSVSHRPATVFPPSGPLAIGRHALTEGGVPFTLELTTPGWTSQGLYGIDKEGATSADGAHFIFWNPDPKGVYADPCTHTLLSPAPGPSVADLAAAVSKVPGTTLVSGPTDVTVGGHAAKRVVLTVREDAKCPAGDGGFYLWYDVGVDSACGDSGDCPRYATALGDTISVWIVDVNGVRLFIDTETHKGASPTAGQEVERIVDSIQFK